MKGILVLSVALIAAMLCGCADSVMGVNGATGLSGLKGDTGATGPAGAKGDTGATGSVVKPVCYKGIMQGVTSYNYTISTPEIKAEPKPMVSVYWASATYPNRYCLLSAPGMTDLGYVTGPFAVIDYGTGTVDMRTVSNGDNYLIYIVTDVKYKAPKYLTIGEGTI